MATKIETLLQESLFIADEKFKGDKVAIEFEKTNNEFKKLVDRGFAQKRGYNLLSVSDKKTFSRVSYNTK